MPEPRERFFVVAAGPLVLNLLAKPDFQALAFDRVILLLMGVIEERGKVLFCGRGKVDATRQFLQQQFEIRFRLAGKPGDHVRAPLQVRELAHAVAAAIPGTSVSINESAEADLRSYRVDFSRFAALAPDHQPLMTLPRSIGRLREGLAEMRFADRDFRRSSLVRLNVLDGHLAAGRLQADLRWAHPPLVAEGAG